MGDSCEIAARVHISGLEVEICNGADVVVLKEVLRGWQGLYGALTWDWRTSCAGQAAISIRFFGELPVSFLWKKLGPD